MKKFNVLILFITLILLGVYLYVVEYVEKDIPTESAEVIELKEQLEYFRGREVSLIEANKKIWEDYKTLKSETENKVQPVIQPEVKSSHEKNPLVSNTQSEYFNSILSNRYQDKP